VKIDLLNKDVSASALFCLLHYFCEQESIETLRVQEDHADYNEQEQQSWNADEESP
jgi:hypothetical protein